MLNDRDRDLLRGKNFASLATLMPDGSPQVSTVWIDVIGDTIVVNTAEHRVKTDNVRRDPRVALCVTDRDDPEVQLIVRGRVVTMTHEGAADHIDALAQRYRGEDYTDHDPDHPRVMLEIVPEHVAHRG